MAGILCMWTRGAHPHGLGLGHCACPPGSDTFCPATADASPSTESLDLMPAQALPRGVVSQCLVRASWIQTQCRHTHTHRLRSHTCRHTQACAQKTRRCTQCRHTHAGMHTDTRICTYSHADTQTHICTHIHTQACTSSVLPVLQLQGFPRQTLRETGPRGETSRSLSHGRVPAGPSQTGLLDEALGAPGGWLARLPVRKAGAFHCLHSQSLGSLSILPTQSCCWFVEG